MGVPAKMSDLFTLAASNSPAGSDLIGNTLDDYIRSHAAIIRSTNALASASVAAASTTDLSASDGEQVTITGAATINSLGTLPSGIVRELSFAGVCTLTNSTALVLPFAANITTAAGDIYTFRSLGSGNWAMTSSTKQSQYLPLTGGTVTGPVAINSTSLTLTSTQLTLNAATPNDRYCVVTTNAVARWRFGGTSDAETGSNAGSNWALTAFNDAGTFLSSPMLVNRATGVATFSARPVFGAATPWDSLNVTPFDKNTGGTIAGQTTITGGLFATNRSSMLAAVNLGGASYSTIVWNGGTGAGTFYVGTNYSNGNAEVDFFNAFGSGAGFNFYKSNGSAFTLLSSLNGSGVWSAADFQATSDIRHKSDIAPLRRGLDALRQMLPREYTIDGVRRLGFIAQEAQKVVPEAVQEDADGFLSLSYGQVTAVLAAAILELDERLTKAGL